MTAEIESTGESQSVGSLDTHDTEFIPVEETVKPTEAPIVVTTVTEPEVTGTSEQDQNDNVTLTKSPILTEMEPSDNTNFDEKRPLTVRLSEEEAERQRRLPEEMIYLPSESPERMVDYFNKIPNLAEETIRDENVEWVQAHQGGLSAVPRFGAFKRVVNRKGAKFRQSLRTPNGVELGPAIPRDDANVVGVVSGADAVRQISHMLGFAGQVTIPLWHSGIWVTIRQPSESSIMELKHRISLEKIEMGRSTSGLVYGNSSVYMAEHVVNMVYEHIHTHSVNLPNGDSLKNYILTTDLQILAWGLASSIWSKGFHYERAVLDDEGRADRVVVEKLNLMRMIVVDNNALSEWQVNHMGNRRPNSMSVAAIKQYQDAFATAQGNVVPVKSNIMVRLKAPALEDYLQQGTRWVMNTVDMINRTLGKDLDDAIRNQFINEQVKSGSARQYSHWVNEIIFTDAEGNEKSKVQDRASIENALVTASRDDTFVQEFIRAVRNFIDDVTFAYICIPFLSEQDRNVYKSHPNLIPLDALYTFFTLIDQRARLIQMRELG